MKCSPQSFPRSSSPALATAILTLSLCWASRAPAGIADEQPPTGDAEVAAAADEQQLPDGSQLLGNVVNRLESVESLSCDLHQTVSFSGMKVMAAGRFVQAAGNRFRLEFRMFPVTPAAGNSVVPVSPDGASAADSAGTDASANQEQKDIRGVLTQVSDGSVLHTYFKNGPEVRVTRRNIRDILAAAEGTKSYGTNAALSDLGVGGLKGLISRIRNDMEFAPVKRQIDGDTELLVVTGRWTKEAKKRLFAADEDVDIFPAEYIPEYTRLLIDGESLLPRRIQYLKRSTAEEGSQVRPIVTLDFRRIELNQDISEDTFAFTPPEGITEEDVTEQTIELIRQLGQPPGTPAAGAAAPTKP